MGWTSGYHQFFDDKREHNHHDSWAAARAALVEDLDQRILAIETGDPEADLCGELAELTQARRFFSDLDQDGEQDATFEAGARTYLLVPELFADLDPETEALMAEFLGSESGCLR